MAATSRTSTWARAVLSDALVLAFLNGAEEFGLQLERDLADLVEKERAAVGGWPDHRPTVRMVRRAGKLRRETRPVSHFTERRARAATIGSGSCL